MEILCKTARKYINQKKIDEMIEEGETDVEEGRLYTFDEAKQMTDSLKISIKENDV